MEVNRNLQQVGNILNLAKLSEDDIKPESHTLVFASEIADGKNVKLLEVSPDVLEYIKSGEW